jgi:HEAT repeat protein
VSHEPPRDPAPGTTPDPAPEGRSIEIPDEPEGTPASASPYRNLLVPLVVVPAMIGMVLVAVFVLFSAITGKPDSPSENLATVLRGGKNERRQAAFSLVRQILEYQQAKRSGTPSEWEIGPAFLPELRNARAELGPLAALQGDDVAIPFVLSSLMAQLGDPEGVQQLIEMTRLTDAVDPQGKYRVDAVFTLGAIGRELAEPERVATTSTLIEHLANSDPGLVLASAACLQNLPGPEAKAALVGCLADARVEIRLQAALSLVRLGDRSGVAVLREMTGPEPYQGEREADPRKWAPQRVSESRVKALQALRELGEPIAPDQLERWANDDADPEVRAFVRDLLASAGPAR